MPEVQTIIGGFKGLDENIASFDKGTKENLTRSMTNVLALHGKIWGRKGLEKLYGLTTQATGQYIGLAQFEQADETSYLIGVTESKVYSISAGGLSDITGTALTSSNDAILSWDIIDDTFIFTNGVDPVRKWAGTGNTAAIGGSPPLARRVHNFEDFLFLGDVTISSIRYPSRIRYSDDWDATWDEANEINLVETHLGIKAWDVIGRTLYVYKGDGVVAIRFIGGPTRFSQHKVPFALGIQAPLSLVNIPQLGHIFLATDFNFYLNANGAINKLPPNMRETLHEDMAPGWSQFAVGSSVPEDDLYMLFFSSGGSWADKRLIFNYRTGEWAVDSYPNHRVIRATGIRLTSGDDWASDGQLWQDDSTTWLDEVASVSFNLVTAMDDRRVYRMDVGHLDDTFTVTRTYFTDWQDYGYKGSKTFNGVDMWCERTPGGFIAVSIASDYKDTFLQRRIYSLDGLTPEDGEVLIQHRTMPIHGNKFNIKLEFIHTRAEQVVLKELGPVWSPLGGQYQTPARLYATQ